MNTTALFRRNFICLCIGLGIFLVKTNAQQANNWYFGDSAAITFNTTPPSALSNSNMYALEGPSSISDSAGNLLFYTNGMKIWNRNHQVMPNGTGLMGNSSSTHASIIIPKPGSNHLYYVFTSDDDEHLYVNGYRYSVIDINLQGGLGDVTAEKNILLYAPSTEKMTAASHINGVDVWLITKELNNHIFRSYKITCNGVDPTPVISTVTAITNSFLGYKTGHIKVSPDGKKIASARNLEGRWDLFKFNNATGEISDRILIKQSTHIGIYGVEFSPDSKLVYLNGHYTFQYKVDIHDSATIHDSKYQVDSLFIQHNALQIGPDNKIYSSMYPKLSVIAQPNVYGVGCTYLSQQISLGNGQVTGGLPTFFNRLVTNYNLDFNYSVSPDCQIVTFNGTGNIPGTLTWHWDFGDGTTGTGQNINHTFPITQNTFIVTLTVNNASVCGGTSSRTKQIVFTRFAPIPDFSFTTSCGNLTVPFNNLSSIAAGGTIAAYKWHFGDGQISNALHPTHAYATFGTYEVKLVVTSADNCQTRDTMTRQVTISANPTASFTHFSGCHTQPVSFNDQSTISGGNISNWSWDFGNGNTSNQQHPVHPYTPGTYTVQLVVTSSANCVSNPVSGTLIVGATPQPDFILPDICLTDASATFNNTSSTTDAGTLSYQWNFGDPNAGAGNLNTSSAINPTHLYSAASLYNVQLIAISSTGCRDTIVKSFTVNGAVPKANFTLLTTGNLCSNTDISIKDSSYVDFGNITKVKIYWGDGDSTIDLTPGQMPNGEVYVHRYDPFGSPASLTYNIQMYSYSGTLCINSYSKTITVFASPEIEFLPIPEVCKESSPFMITQASEIWSLPGSGAYSGNGVINGNTGMFDPFIAAAGSHAITYTFITSAGCRADSVRSLVINPTPKASFTFSKACMPDAAIQFTSTASLPGGFAAGLQHAWMFDDPLATASNPNTSGSMNPLHTYHSLEMFSVQLTTTSAKGCIHDTIINVLPDIDIYAQPIADFKIDSSKAICAGSPVYFLNQSTGGAHSLTSYAWTFGTTTSTAINPNHTFNNHGNYTASLQVKNDKGCMSAITNKPVAVHSTPVANFTYDSACIGKPVQFEDISNNTFGAINTWNWNLGNASSSPVQHPVTIYNNYQPNTVSLSVATVNKCVSDPLSKVLDIRRIIISAGHDTSVAQNQPLQLQASGALSYSWSPAAGLNNNSISNPVAILNNINARTYYLTGITAEGCMGFDTINIKVFTTADMYVPNAFTPNGDGLNDGFGPICIGIKKLNYFRVYNKYGELVHSSRDEFDKWNGKFKGKHVPAGNYVWMVEGINFEGKVLNKSGSVLLLQ